MMMQFHSEIGYPFGLFCFIVINTIVIGRAENRKNIIVVRLQFEFNVDLDAHFMFENCRISHISLSLLTHTRRRTKHQMHTHTLTAYVQCSMHTH